MVKHTYEGDELITYAIYLNNRIFLKPARGKLLGRKMAYAFCDMLNEDERSWPEPPKTRAELMAMR